MIPETKNQQEAKSVSPGKHAPTAQADLDRYFRKINNVGFIARRLKLTIPVEFKARLK